MMIARFHIEARFGHKDAVIAAGRRWLEEVGARVGFDPNRVRVLTGSVGACESAVVTEFEVADLGALNAAWDKMAKLEAHQRFGKDLEQHIVSGSNRWEIFRVV